MRSLAMIAEKDFAGRQSIGKRAGQEDTYAFSEIPARPGAATGLLLVVADGMGGHSAGNRGSDLAVRHFVGAFHRGGGETMRERFLEALDAANQAIAAAVEAEPEDLDGMGTTLLAVAATPLGLEWISVGDSPLYLWRRGRLRRLNEDHSFRPVLHDKVASGEMTEVEAATSALRTRLRAAVNGHEIELVDVSRSPLPLLEGDIVLAGSDGLQTLSDEAIAAVVERNEQAEASPLAVRIVQAVLDAQQPKQDNTTAAILKPPADWLFAPFGFATPEPAATGEDMANITQRIVPRTLRSSSPPGDPPAPAP
jgi:PPM family protein phosphatase